jgi:hypothetical protein
VGNARRRLRLNRTRRVPQTARTTAYDREGADETGPCFGRVASSASGTLARPAA